MDASRFDRFTRFLAAGSSRRAVLGALAALSMLPVSPDLAGARKGKKRLQRNNFGCVDVGGKCRGKDSNCCSGICQGKKPKKGEKDKSTCVAHDTGTLLDGPGSCPVTDRACGADSCRTSTGQFGECHMTTGNAPYCISDDSNGECMPCAKDVDCEPFCGPGAACIRCTSGFCGSLSTMCGGTGSCTF